MSGKVARALRKQVYGDLATRDGRLYWAEKEKGKFGKGRVQAVAGKLRFTYRRLKEAYRRHEVRMA